MQVAVICLLMVVKIPKDFTVDKIKKTGFNPVYLDFSVDYNAIDVSNTVDIHKYLIKNMI